MPESKTPETEQPKKKDEEVKFVECPSSKEQRVGDFRNEKKLERVIDHKRSEDGTRCITIYENVSFKESVHSRSFYYCIYCCYRLGRCQ